MMTDMTGVAKDVRIATGFLFGVNLIFVNVELQLKRMRSFPHADFHAAHTLAG